MKLDAADLATLELDAQKLGPIGCAVVEMLIEQIRDQEDEVAFADKLLVDAQDKAKDAKIVLDHLRNLLTDMPYEVDQKVDAVEELLVEIQELGE